MRPKMVRLLAASLVGGLFALAMHQALCARARAAEGTAPSAGIDGVVINEVAWMGTGASAYDEWIELYNSTASPITLTGWTLSDGGDVSVTLSGVVSADGYFLLERTDDGTVSDVLADQIYAGSLDNAGEALVLRDAGEQIVDTANGDGGSWPAGDSVTRSAMERVAPHAPDADDNWCTNDGVTRNGLDAADGLVNGTPRARNSCYLPPAAPSANLELTKNGPITATPGGTVFYSIILSNTGAATATQVVLTDTLPGMVDLLSQTRPLSFTQSEGLLVWQFGEVQAGTSHAITLTGRVTDAASGLLVNRVRTSTTATETVTADNTAACTTTVGVPRVLVGAVLYDGYQSGDYDEAVQLVNVGSAPADLSGWRIDDDVASTGFATIVTATLDPGQRLWMAWRGADFALSFGFAPDLEIVDTDPAVPDGSGSWPGFANSGDEVVLRDGADALVDLVVYEEGDVGVSGWGGDPIRPYGSWGQEGQILYRIPDEATGLPVGDTDAAADWIQSTGDALRGRRVLYPGWDLAPLFWPLSATEPATMVVGIAPDNAFDVISQTIARAQRAISVEVYSLRHPEVVTALVGKAQAGVSVTVLLEGGQAGVSTSDPAWQQELWACREIESAGGRCWFMVHDPSNRIYSRYDYLHAKLLIVDDTWVVVGSQNLTLSGLPSDDKSNGTYGSRGVALAMDARSAVARAAQVFALDLDPARHSDLQRWSPGLTGTYGPPVITYTPQLTAPDFTTTPVRFPEPLVVSGTFGLELLTAPEAALRRSDALLGLVARAGAGDAIYVEQLYEHADWGDNPTDDPNLRLDAYVAAARRGATVRILLNGGSFGQPGFRNVNTATVAYVRQIARAEGLDLEAAVGDPTRYGIHNKMVLAWLQDEGGYAHIGSINGSESSSKVNREIAVQIRADAVYAYLKRMFDLDWQWSQPVHLPLVMQRYVPPADHLLVSEVYYWGGCEWVEIYNPTPLTATLGGFKLGDAQTADRFEGMYVFPDRELASGDLLLVAGDATQCNLTYVPADYELFGSHPGVPNLSRDPSWGTGEFSLGNSGDEVLLLGPSNRAVDAVVYGGGSYAGVIPHPGVEPGDALERVPPYADTDDCGRDFRAGWSPGWTQAE